MPDWIRMNMISKEGAFTMAKVFITLTGTKHYFGNTVIGESMSAGRLYDKIGDVAYAKVILATPAGTICKICKKSLVKDEEQ